MFKRKKLIVFIGVIFIGLLLGIGLLRQRYVVPILMYHSVTPFAAPNNGLAITPDTFERQMRFLKKHNYRVMPLESLACLIREKKNVPSKTLAITLDDGYKDNYIYAYPILKKYNLPAAIFIIVNEVGRPQNDRLRWEEIKKMRDSGLISIGSHTLGPDPLFKMKSEEELKGQIFDSKKILEEKLGKEVALFSYPEGMFDAKIRELVIDAGYKAAVATNPGRNYSNDDIFALKRLRISRNCANMFVFAIETSGYYTLIKESKKHRHEKK